MASVIKPICLYKISTFALLCYAEVEKFEKLPKFEMREIEFFDDLPENLSYQEGHTLLFNKVKEP